MSGNKLPILSTQISLQEHNYSIQELQNRDPYKSTIQNRNSVDENLSSESETNRNDNYKLQELLVEPLIENVVNVSGVTFSTNIPLEDVCHTEYPLEITPIDNLTFSKELYDVTYLNETCKVCLKDLTSSDDKIAFFDDLTNVSSKIMGISTALQSMGVEITRDVKLPQQICIECYNTFLDMTRIEGVCKRSKRALDNIYEFVTKSLEKMAVKKDVGFSCIKESEIEIKDELLEKDVAVFQNANQFISNDVNPPTPLQQNTSANQNFKHMYICFRCGRYFPRQSSLVHHRNYDYCVDEECPECRICGEKLPTVDDLDCHIATSHNQISCTICARPFGSLTLYHEHQQSHNPLICDFCGDAFYIKKDILLHMKQHIIGAFPCLFCEQRFETSKRLGMHKRDEHPNELYKCPHCSKEYKLKDKLRTHMLSHNSDKPHKCTYCEKQFVVRQHLENHIRTHTKEKPFLCSFCGNTYRQEIALKDHLSVHDPKLYPPRRKHPNRVAGKPTKIHYCDLCSYSTNQGGNMKKHKIRHLDGPPVRKLEFICQICDKGFRLERSLANHVLIHNEVRDYKCTQCKASFTKPHYLRIHVDGVHLRKRPYKCDQCDVGYLMSNDLKRHKMQKHSSERPFECYICQKSFGAQLNLKIHIRKVHKKEENLL